MKTTIPGWNEGGKGLGLAWNCENDTFHFNFAHVIEKARNLEVTKRNVLSLLASLFDKLQKRAMKVIYPLLSYTMALQVSGLSTLHEGREAISSKTFAVIKEDESHKLHELLPENTTGRLFP